MSAHFDPNSQTSEETITEDGKYKYWRVMTPFFMQVGMWWYKRFICSCGGRFKSKEAAELHFRKAYGEERDIWTHNEKLQISTPGKGASHG